MCMCVLQDECNRGRGAYQTPPDYFNQPEPITEPNIPYGMGFNQEETINRRNNEPIMSPAQLLSSMIAQTRQRSGMYLASLGRFGILNTS